MCMKRLGKFSGAAAIVLLGACSQEKSKTSSSEYNALVKKYNALAEDITARNGRVVQTDQALKLATQSLQELDASVAKFKELLEETGLLVDAKKCTEANANFDGKLSKQLSQVNLQANVLMQGTLDNALEIIATDMEAYKVSSQSIVRSEVNLLRGQLGSSLTGIKELSRYSYNELVDDYNSLCASKRSGVAPPLPEDSVITVDAAGERKVITRDDFKSRYKGTFSEPAYNDFQSLASGTGGIMGFSPTSEQFSETVNVVFENILRSAGAQTDVAIVLDTTSSMDDDIANVKANMKTLLAKLKEKQASIGLRIGLLLYRDVGDAYVTKIVNDLTADIDAIDTQIQVTQVAGGGDTPEAVLTALEAAKDSLGWRPGASRSVILIGDAPGQPNSASGRSTAQVSADYKKAGLGIVIYPILVSE